MKIILLLFVAIDFIFVGLILKFYNNPSQRTISSAEDSFAGNLAGDLAALSEGQKNKWLLIESFEFAQNDQEVILRTTKLQMICETSEYIELRFLAQQVAFAGKNPGIMHTFPCAPIRNTLSQDTLKTSIVNILKLHKEKLLQLENSQMKATSIYADEEFPTHWKLAEIRVSGPSTFTINEHEIDKVKQQSFVFNLPISAE